jgi:predicted Rossmann-fold nucleotide-binding protein
MPIVVFGTEYWREVVNFDALVKHGTISARDLKLMHHTDSVDDAYDWITRSLMERSLDKPGPTL